MQRNWPDIHLVARVVGAFLTIAVATVLISLARAGAPFPANWPANYNLTSSDNGVLYQVVQDLFSGATLDWSFSPQVYVFPEIPVSVLAYLLTAGNLGWYFIAVAVINMLLLFAALLWLARLLTPGPSSLQLGRALLATSPLLIAPLIAIQHMYVFHLAPTYYFGMYLFALLLPAAVLSRSRWARAMVIAGWALTGAANPLLWAMSLPGATIALLVLATRRSSRQLALRAALTLTCALVAGVIIRVALFTPMVGTDPTNYISASRFAERLRGISGFFGQGFRAQLDPVLLVASLLALFVCLVLTGRILIREFRRTTGTGLTGTELASRVYLGTLPVLGALAMAGIMALHMYYLWFVVVGSLVVALLLIPIGPGVRVVGWAVTVATLIAASVGIAAGGSAADRYFTYRSPATSCLDQFTPGQIGYSTFSDARSLSLPSDSGVRLIAVNPDLSPNFWLTNRANSKERVGTFIVMNPQPAEPVIPEATVRERWGEPDAVVNCAGIAIWTYDSSAAHERIAQWFHRYQLLR